MSKADARGRTNPTRAEHAAIVDLMIVRNDLIKNGEALKERLSGHKNAWRDLRLLITLVNRLQDMLRDTLPDKRVLYYEKLGAHGRNIVDIPGPVPPPWHILMSADKLAAITAAAMEAECAMCVRDGKEVARCRLREALIEAAPPDAYTDTDSPFAVCEYRDAGSKLACGKEVRI